MPTSITSCVQLVSLAWQLSCSTMQDILRCAQQSWQSCTALLLIVCITSENHNFSIVNNVHRTNYNIDILEHKFGRQQNSP